MTEGESRSRRVTPLLVAVYAALSVGGCAGLGRDAEPVTEVPRLHPVPGTGSEIDHDAEFAEYRVAPGDTLSLLPSHRHTPIDLPVQPDGCIRLDDSRSIRVDNLTPGEIASKLDFEAGPDYDNCEVDVRDFNSQFVYLFVRARGESPRAVPYEGPESLSEFLERADPPRCRVGYRIRVVRPGEQIGDAPEIHATRCDKKLRLRRRFRDGPPVRLQPGDYVYLEKNLGSPSALMRMTGRRFREISEEVASD